VGALTSAHIFGTLVPVEEPSTASKADMEWVYLDSATTCGLALSAGYRVVVPDIETCDFMAANG
jgi:hypothetical protein